MRFLLHLGSMAVQIQAIIGLELSTSPQQSSNHRNSQSAIGIVVIEPAKPMGSSVGGLHITSPGLFFVPNKFPSLKWTFPTVSQAPPSSSSTGKGSFQNSTFTTFTSKEAIAWPWSSIWNFLNKRNSHYSTIGVVAAKYVGKIRVHDELYVEEMEL